MGSEVARLDEHTFIYSTVLPQKISNFLNKSMVCTMQLNNFQGMQAYHHYVAIYMPLLYISHLPPATATHLQSL